MTSQFRKKNTNLRLKVPSSLLFLSIFSSYSLAAQQNKNVSKRSTPKEQVQNLKKMKPRKVGALGYLEGSGNADGKTENELVEMIRSFRLLIDQEPQGYQRNNYLLAETSGYLALSRLYRLRPENEMNPKDRERDKASNLRAIKNAAEIFTSKVVQGEQQAKALYYGGLAQINLGDFEAARKSFLQSVEVNPKSPQAPAMNLFVSENLFEKEKYEEALRQYGVYYKQYNNPQKALAIYKMGWSHLNLERFQAAEKMFVILAGQAWAGSFADDAIKDLAYISSLFRTEAQSIEFASNQFSQALSVRLQYLTELYLYFQSQSTTQKKPLLLAEILRLEKNPAKRMKVLIATLRSSQRGSASLQPLQDFASVESEMKSQQVTSSALPTWWKDIGSDLEVEVLTLSKAFADTFFGRVKSAEKIPENVLGEKTKPLLRFHLSYFPQANERPNTWKIYLSVCKKMNDTKCVYDVAHEILAEKLPSELRTQASLDLIRATEELSQKDPNLKSELVQNISSFLNEFPQDPNWLVLAKKLTLAFNEQKKFAESLPWLKLIHQREKSSESSYRLLWVLYELGKHSDIAVEEIPKEGKFAAEIKGLIRESHLHLAENAANQKDEKAYEENVKKFLSLNRDDKKADLVKLNFLKRLYDQKNLIKLNEEVMQIPPTKRYSAEFSFYSSFLVNEELQVGNVQKAAVLLGNPQTPKEPVFAMPEAVVLLSTEKKQDWLNSASRWKDEQRTYFYSVLALADAAALVQFAETQKIENEDQKKAVYLALQILQNKTQPDAPKSMTKTFASLSQGSNPNRPSRVTSEYNAITYPKPTWKPAKYEKFAQDVVFRVRKARKRVSADLEFRPFEMQKAILEMAVTAETKTADMILQSPIPDQLQESQKAEYQQGIQQLALEFKNQSAEFSKVLGQITALKTAEEAAHLKSPQMDKWNWPKTNWTNQIYKLAKENKKAAALVYLDYLGAKISADDRERMRVGVLLMIESNQILRDYLKSELELGGHLKLLEEWKGLQQ